MVLDAVAAIKTGGPGFLHHLLEIAVRTGESSTVVLLTLRVWFLPQDLTRSVRSTFGNPTLIDSPVLIGVVEHLGEVPAGPEFDACGVRAADALKGRLMSLGRGLLKFIGHLLRPFLGLHAANGRSRRMLLRPNSSDKPLAFRSFKRRSTPTMV